MYSYLRGGGGGQPKFLGKLGLELGVFQKAAPIGGSFGEVSESLHDSRARKWALPGAQFNYAPHLPKIYLIW